MAKYDFLLQKAPTTAQTDLTSIINKVKDNPSPIQKNKNLTDFTKITDKYSNSNKPEKQIIKDFVDKYDFKNDLSTFKKENFSKSINTITDNFLKLKINTNSFINNLNNTNIISGREHVDVRALVAQLPDELKHQTDIGNISMRAKRQLLRVLVKANSELFTHTAHDLPLLPTNKEQYCALMKKLVKSVGFDVAPLSAEKKAGYHEAMTALETIIPDVDLSKLKIGLHMPRKVFIERVQTELQHLPEAEQRKAMDYFGFEIRDNKLVGYPVNLNNGEKLAEIKSYKTKQAIESLRPVVHTFSEGNSVILPPEQKALEDELNKVVRAFPEFLTTIGKPQHGTHAYTLDIHSLKVLQGVMTNPLYKTLPQEDKKLLSTAALLHDIAKAEGQVDKTHPFESAFDTYFLANKLEMPVEQVERLSMIVKNHDWLKELSNIPEHDSVSLQRMAFEFRKPNDFAMSKILADADLKGVSDNFYSRYKEALTSPKVQKIEENLAYMRQTGVFLPQTKIPKASEIDMPAVSIGHLGSKTTNKVIVLEDNPDLKKIGFPKGTTNDFASLVHVFKDFNTGISTLNELSGEINGGVLSTSYIDKNHFSTYYSSKIGVLLEHEPSNIICASQSNIASGTKKDIKNQALKIFEKSTGRSAFSDKVKQELGLSNEQYAQLYTELIQHQNIDDIKDEKVKKAIINAAHGLFTKDFNNEITVLAPKPSAIFVKDTAVKDIPYEVRKYAQDNDMAIVVFGKAS